MDNSQIVYGLEKYFNFTNDSVKEKFVRHLINLQHHTNEDKAWALKEIISYDYESLSELGRHNRLDIYTNIFKYSDLTVNSTIALFDSVWPDDEFCKKLSTIFYKGPADLLPIIFTRTQVLSKIWLAETISKFNNSFQNVLLLGGWTTHHTMYFKNIAVENLYSVDVDSSINEFARLFNKNVIIENADVNYIFNDENDILIRSEKQQFDLVVNTSAEHMSTDWFNKLKPGTPVVIQSNNMDAEGHINKADNLADFLKKYPMSKTYYRGEMNFDSYRRFMLYGIK